MCRRRHVYVRAWAMRRRRHVVHGHGILARRTFALITFLSVTDIYTYASSESTPLLHDSLPRFPLGNYMAAQASYPVAKYYTNT